MRPLPYLYDAELVDPGDLHVADLHVSVWPASGQESNDAGEHFTHTGEAPPDVKPLLTHNRSLIIATGEMAGRYKIVGATSQPFIPHVGLELLRTDAGGG